MDITSCSTSLEFDSQAAGYQRPFTCRTGRGAYARSATTELITALTSSGRPRRKEFRHNRYAITILNLDPFRDASKGTARHSDLSRIRLKGMLA